MNEEARESEPAIEGEAGGSSSDSTGSDSGSLVAGGEKGDKDSKREVKRS